MMYFIHYFLTNMFRPEYLPKHVGENIVNKLHCRILKCILLVIYICLSVIYLNKCILKPVFFISKLSLQKFHVPYTEWHV